MANFEGGRIASHIPFWTTITSDFKILNVVQFGIKLEFDHQLKEQTRIPRQYKFSDTEHEAISNEIQSLLHKSN